MRKRISFLLVLSILLSLAACGGNGSQAATMRLVKTEGAMQVADETGAAVAIRENLGLFSGYGLTTETESYGWINLDDTKQVKMDQSSNVVVKEEDRLLELEVLSGTLFFNVTKPLDEDETMNIRSSNMLVGIRGTCGWVEVPESGRMNVYLLEGTVACTAGDKTVTISAGEAAAMAEDGEITVSKLTVFDVADFVSEEVQDDEALAAAVQTASGLDVTAEIDLIAAGIIQPIESLGEIPGVYQEKASRDLEYAQEYGYEITFLLIDLQQDGNPELLVFNRSGVSIYQNGPEGVIDAQTSIPIGWKLSLMESGGEFFLHSTTGSEQTGYIEDWYFRMMDDYRAHQVLHLENFCDGEHYVAKGTEWNYQTKRFDGTDVFAYNDAEAYEWARSQFKELTVLACYFVEENRSLILPTPEQLLEYPVISDD